MRVAKRVSITLPPDLLVKAQEAAVREHRTMSELFREALRHYISQKPQANRETWNELLAYGQAKGSELGIATEADVERLSDEYRASNHA